MKLLGYLLLSLPFIAVTIFSVKTVGVITTLMIWGITFLVFLVIAIGAYLITQ